MALLSRLRPPRAFRWALPSLLALTTCAPTVEIPDDATACAGLQCTAGQCFSNAGQPMCRCGDWERNAEVPCHVAHFEQPDDHGGSPEDATVLRPPVGPVEGRISESRREGQYDLDLFTFTAEARHVYVFHFESAQLRPGGMRLLDASGRVVNTFLDTFVRDGVRSATRVATLDAGVWYLEVSGNGEAGTYTYQLTDLGRDDHGDTFAEATPLQDVHHQPFTVTHSFPQDRDVFTFRATRLHGYRFTCERPRRGPVPESETLTLRLLTASGEQVAEDSGRDGVPVAVGLEAPRDEDFFVEVRAQKDVPLLATSTCVFEDLGVDEHADGPAGATPLAPGIPVRVVLQTDDDRDVFSFTGQAGHVYTLSTEPQGFWGARVLDAQGQSLKNTNTRMLAFQPETTGTFFLELRPLEPAARAFQLTLVDEVR
ncbi:PPC domain-containing protein [Pyxidicoccus parkwayensis]|uniref:PPC domain-containing protein n=1 Tax=Pyxidicoccus parkwayensis TaxID=2813578 RepID=A0ABX7P2U8_9BACT|nr:PPC domain-containing protein [Pyxidicoccus parkwaysis]QSQ24780.1 PPC domain-containing protein [Pyxidicoccus parkwaysis]